LLGTIFLGDPKSSLATIKEDGYGEADIYAVGDLVVGNEDAIIADIGRNKVVINNRGKKECLAIDLGEKLLGLDDSGSPAKAAPMVLTNSDSSITLQSSYVESELGPGFGRIIQSARLVPHTLDNGSVNGFKIFAIEKGTLFDKIGLAEGDVITQVNNTVLQAESGFSLYQSFLDEREIKLRVLRNAQTPQTITVQIK
jgi:type II secretion system protein C